MYVVCVNFEIKPEAISTFMPLMHAQARNSLDSEPGCKRFDVCVSEHAENLIFLFELYDDRAAFDVHLAAPYFKEFDAAVSDMVISKIVNTYTLG